ncbi:MAG: DNA adenine methylase [Brevundimonas sp.]|uniref:DNA adenine methylase n=1 Tax=Brevundimonas sp. TaxID=1871086 RepID=UPI001A1A4302|nr:DNA adenine methylase [Brevundimonas sp.]MBJ7318227.1 DNA adenine methylase [Brevundimonas sp.]
MESIHLAEVLPIRPVAPYVGGKRSLSRHLVQLISRTPHATYAEPFVGMGGVFFRRDRRPQQEVINDLSGDVANLFRVIQEHNAPLIDELRFKLASRNEFNRLMRQDPATLTDLRRAARFLYLQVQAFGGRVHQRHFGVALGKRARFDFTQIVPRLQDIHERLAGVMIEQLPFDRFIERYDRPDTLFYCDPPYWGTEDYYGADLFNRGDFERLSACLKAVRGRFILSLNDVPEVRDIFSWAAIQAVDLNYHISGRATPAKEVIITGGG